MSSFKAFFAALVLVLATAGCGFQPMYGDGAVAAKASQAVYNDIDIANIPDRDGQYLRNQLVDKMYLGGTPASTKYTLAVAPLSKKISDVAIRKDGTYTRGEIRFDATVTLTDKATNKVVLTRELRAVGGFNLLDNQMATLVSQQALTDHLLEELSDSIINELSLYFSR